MEPLKATAATMKMHEEFIESLWDFIHLPLTRQQVVCERPTSDASVYAMHSHGNRSLILFQGLGISFLLHL